MSDLFAYHLELHDLSPSGVRIVTGAIQTHLRDIGTFDKQEILFLTELDLDVTVDSFNFPPSSPSRRRRHKRSLVWRRKTKEHNDGD